MIPADVEVLDLDPAHWARLSELSLAARQGRTWWYVLHSAGRVLTMHPADVPVLPGEAVPEPDALARRLLDLGTADRVVVLDRDQLPTIAISASALVEPGGALTTYREQVEDLYWSSPAVVTAPVRPTNPWRSLRLAVEAIFQGTLVLAVVDEHDQLTTALLLELDEGVVTSVRSPVGESPADLGTHADLLLVVREDDLVAALRSGDLTAGLLRAASQHPASRGLPRVSAAVDRPVSGRTP